MRLDGHRVLIRETAFTAYFTGAGLVQCFTLRGT